jgi:carboxylesterase type B
VQRTVNGSDDYLYRALYSRPWTRSDAPRPAVVFSFGEAFIEGSASFSSLPPPGYPTLDVSAGNDVVMVYPNCRTKAFGFLPGSRIKQDPESDLNPGLMNEQIALEWVHKYIEHFAGDP